MGRLENFREFSPKKLNEDQEDLTPEEALEEALSMIDKAKLARFLNDRGLELENIESANSDGESILVSISSLDLTSRIPNRISYYLDEFNEILQKEIGIKTSWSFSPNYNCTDIIFYLEDPIDPRVYQVKQALRFS